MRATPLLLASVIATNHIGNMIRCGLNDLMLFAPRAVLTFSPPLFSSLARSLCGAAAPACITSMRTLNSNHTVFHCSEGCQARSLWEIDNVSMQLA